MKIKFDTCESCMGTEYLTPCPHEQKGRYTHELINVGSKACRGCKYHVDKKDNYVICKFKKDVSVLPKKEKQAIFTDPKKWWR